MATERGGPQHKLSGYEIPLFHKLSGYEIKDLAGMEERCVDS